MAFNLTPSSRRAISGLDNERLFVEPEAIKLDVVGDALDLFAPATRDWFRAAFAEPTPVQERGWREVAAGRHVLMAAPTGSGKTLAAFLWCLDRLASEPMPAEAERYPP
jgi:superfamily II DNA/RNA helicase